MAKIYADRVLESSTATGTGALTLEGAIAGFRRFSAVCAVADTVDYTVFAVDTSGLPTGDWETGLGTYSAANTLTRTTVQASSNANAAVNFAAGSKQVMLGVNAASLATLGSGGGGGGGSSPATVGKQIVSATTWGGDTSTSGASIPGASFTFTVPADGVYLVKYYIRYQNSHRVRANIYMDGSRFMPGDDSSADRFDFNSYSVGDQNWYHLYMEAAGTLTAGSHTVDAKYNAMDSTAAGGTTNSSYVTITKLETDF